MSKKLQCQDCGQAEYGEDLYNYDGKILCRYCIVARVYEDSTPCEYVGICNDETFPNKTEQIDQLKQQLAEKDKEIKKLNWQLKDKDFIIKNLNHSLSVAPNANAGQRARIDELTKIVKEKDKEIERLKQQNTLLENENGKLTTELIMDKYKKAQKEVSFGNQLAIQELEKVKMITEWKFNSIVDVVNYIEERLKELKGE